MIPHPRRGEQAGSLLDAALDYLARGWSIIPTKGKRPACKWTRYQETRPSETELRELFSQGGITGLAVVLGSVSGGLACRDFDDLDAYREWKAAHPKLARTLPTVKTARGRHVYFRGPNGFQDCGDGEYRADSGHYCLLPPSRHPDGPAYRWIVPLQDGELPTFDPVKVGLCLPESQMTCSGTRVLCNSGTQLLGYSGSQLSNTCNGEDGKFTDEVEKAITETLPVSGGHRNRRVFELCRRLRAIPLLASADPSSLRPVIQEWHRRALPVIGTKDFLETFGDFVRGWQGVKHAAGDGPIDEAFHSALKRKPPRRAVELYGADHGIVKLATLCRELQRRAGDAEFYLDVRTAGRLLNVSHVTAGSWLAVLRADGILELRERGSQATHRASRYLYIVGQR